MATDRQVQVYWQEEFVLIAILFLFFVGIVVFAVRLPFDARLFPLVVGSAGVLLCSAVAIGEYRRWRSPTGAADAVADDDPATKADRQRCALALLSAPVFGLLLWLLGFFAASLAAMLLLPSLMGYRRWGIITIVALGTIVVLALIFSYLLGINLPRGIVGEWLVDRLRTH